MANIETATETREYGKWDNHERNSRVLTGIFILVVGSLALARSFNAPLPVWLFKWETFLIGMGFFIGIRRGFQGVGWFILILVGAAFLLNDFYFDGDLRRHIWPVVLIGVGVFFILRPRKKGWQQKLRRVMQEREYSGMAERAEDFAETTILFGSAKKNVVSKKFTGGDITSVFASAELDFTDADIQGNVVIDVTAIFGGVELIIPSHWTIKSDVVSVFGSVKDKRIQEVGMLQDQEKIIILDGTALFGGIEIRSFKK